jgi:SAM-dependent methyltransferase
MGIKTIHRILLEEELDRIIPTLNGKVVLDMGAKDMRYAHYFKNSTYVALDIEPLITSGVMVQGDAHNLPFADNTFDIIISTEVIEHTTWPWIVLQELARVLKPNGKLVISWPWLYPITHHDYWRIHLESMKKLATKNNLKIEFSTEIGGLCTNISMGFLQIAISKIKRPYFLLRLVFSLLYRFALLDKSRITKKDASDFLAVMVKQL